MMHGLPFFVAFSLQVFTEEIFQKNRKWIQKMKGKKRLFILKQVVIHHFQAALSPSNQIFMKCFLHNHTQTSTFNSAFSCDNVISTERCHLIFMEKLLITVPQHFDNSILINCYINQISSHVMNRNLSCNP